MEFYFVVADSISCSFCDALEKISISRSILIDEVNEGPEFIPAILSSWMQ
jgi:hypothetical protein